MQLFCDTESFYLLHLCNLLLMNFCISTERAGTHWDNTGVKKKSFTGFIKLELQPPFHKFPLCVLARKGEFCPHNKTQQYSGLLSDFGLLDNPNWLEMQLIKHSIQTRLYSFLPEKTSSGVIGFALEISGFCLGKQKLHLISASGVDFS